MLNKYDYSFNYEDSFVHRMSPLIKIFSLFVYILVCLFKYNNYLFIFSLSYVFCLLLLSNIKLRKYIKVIWKFKYILIIIAFYMYSRDISLIDGSVVMLKIIFLILHIFMILFTTTRSQVVRSLTWLVDRINIIGFNKKKIYNFIDNIYSFIFKFIDVYNDTIIYKEINGIDYVHSNILSRSKLVLCNVKNVYKNTKSKVHNIKKDKKNRLFDERIISKYKYVNRLCIMDYLVLIINIGMVIFYVMKVR